MKNIPNYLSVLVHFVIGELDLLERHDLFPQLFPGVRGVRVSVQPIRSGGIRFARHQPRRSMVRVSVAFVVHWNHV